MSNEVKDMITDYKIIIMELTEEINWYRTYAEFINKNFPNVDAEASQFADEN